MRLVIHNDVPLKDVKVEIIFDGLVNVEIIFSASLLDDDTL